MTTSDTELIGKAIAKVIEAYDEYIMSEGIDPAYTPILKIVAGVSTTALDKILETVTWEYIGYDDKEPE